jgi:hypothetical protein
MTKDSEIFSSMICANTAFIFSKGDIQDPVQLVFGFPVAVLGSPDCFCIGRQAGLVLLLGFQSRDVTLKGDAMRMTVGNTGIIMASLNNLILALIRQAKFFNAAQTRRWFAANLVYAFAPLTTPTLRKPYRLVHDCSKVELRTRVRTLLFTDRLLGISQSSYRVASSLGYYHARQPY